MASGSAIRAGAAYVELFTRDGKFVKGLDAAQQKFRAFGKGLMVAGGFLTGVGTAIVGPIVAAANQFSTFGDAIAKAAKRTGISIEALSGLGFAAEQSGATIGDLETSLKRMAKLLFEASSGSQAAADTLGQLGLSVDQLAGQSPEEQFKRLAEALSHVEDPSRRAALAMELFGRSGTQLIPLIDGGREAIEELQREAARLGLVLSTEDARAAEELNDALNRMWRSLKAITLNIGAAVAPVLSELSNRVAAAAAEWSKWVKENRSVIITALKVGAGIAAAGTAVTALGVAIVAATTVIGGLSAAFAFCAANLAAIGFGAAIVGIAAVTYGISRAVAATTQWNRELERLHQLTLKFNARDQQALQATLAKGQKLQDPAARRQFFADQIEQQRQELERRQAAAAKAKQDLELERLNSGALFDLPAHKNELRGLEAELKEAEARVQATSDAIEALRDAAKAPLIPAAPQLDKLKQASGAARQIAPNEALRLGSQEALRAIVSVTGGKGIQSPLEALLAEQRTNNDLQGEANTSLANLERNSRGGPALAAGQV
jgi:hypothetical protein